MAITRTMKYKLNRSQLRKLLYEEVTRRMTGGPELKDGGDHDQRGEVSASDDTELSNPKLDYSSHLNEDSGEEEGDHYDLNAMSDEEHIEAIRRHLDHLEKDKEYDDDHVEDLKESRLRALRILRHLAR